MSNRPSSPGSEAGGRSLSFPDATNATKGLSPRDKALLSLVLVLSVLIYAPTIRWLFGRWTMSVWHHAHGLFIPPIVAYLVWQQLTSLRDLQRESSPWGFALMIPALLLHVLDVGIHTEILSAGSIVVFLPGMSLLFLGKRRTRSIIFLLFFLFFMLPIPLSLTKGIHSVLRDITAGNIAWAIPRLGIPIYVEGTMINLPKSNLLVADACSGFSTLYAMAAVTCLTVHLSPYRFRSLLALLIAAPIAILANTLRAIILVVSVYWYGPDILKTWVHSFSGIFAMVLALVVIFWAGGLMLKPPTAKT